MSIQDLAERAKLPVIAITKSRMGRKIGRKHTTHIDIPVKDGHVAVSAAGVEKDEAERLYRIGCSPYGKIPEAVRIADLLAEALSRTKKSQSRSLQLHNFK